MPSQSTLFSTVWIDTTASLFKRLLFPGMNLLARERYSVLPTKFGREIAPGATVLDAGCGNGMLAYQAWKRGAKVLGLSIKQREIDGCRAMFNEGKGISETQLRFENLSLLDAAHTLQSHQFDAIICTEVLEHIPDDRSVCVTFFDLLKPGGCLHVTTPNAEHSYNKFFPLDLEGRGGHVRPGYTIDSYRALFEPIGFTIEESCGLGGPIRQAFNWCITEVQERVGVAAGLLPFFAALPFLWLDSKSPRVPVCFYVKLQKPVTSVTSHGPRGTQVSRRAF